MPMIIFLCLIAALIPNLAHAQSSPTPVTRAVLQHYLLDETQCNGSAQQLELCWRMADYLVAELLARNDVYFLTRTQIELDNNWTLALAKDEPNPIFKTENLLLATLSDLGKKKLEARQKKTFKAWVEFRLSMRDRYTVAANALYLSGFSGNEFYEVFTWVLENCSSADMAKALFAAAQTATIHTTTGDFFSQVNVHQDVPSAIMSREVSFGYQGEEVWVKYVRPRSVADTSGVRVGFKLLSIGAKKVTSENASNELARLEENPSLGTTFVKTDDTHLFVPSLPIFQTSSGINSFHFELGETNIAVISIQSFYTANFCTEVKHQIINALQPKTDGIIIDLRDNSGGLLENAKCLGGLLFGKNRILANLKFLETGYYSTIRGTSSINTNELRKLNPLKTAEERIVPDSVPITFLTNAETASASEILSGYAQEENLAWLVGQRSYGKGLSIEVIPSENYRGIETWAVAAHILLPSGNSFHLVGNRPDFPVSSSIANTNDEPWSVRFLDSEGKIFPFENIPRMSDRIRLYEKSEIQRCIQQRLHSEILARDSRVQGWLMDQQLKTAALVNNCEIQKKRSEQAAN